MEDVILRVGDQLFQPGLVTHVMTYVGPIGSAGEDVLDAPKGGPAQLVRLTEVAARGPISIGERGPLTWQEQQFVQQRALSSLGVMNRTIWPNCEHISSFVRKGEPESPQLAIGFGMALLIFGLVLGLSGT